MEPKRVVTPTRLVVLLCLVNLSGGFALGFATRCKLGGPSLGPPGPPSAEMLFQFLDVTPEQQPRVREVYERFMPRLRSLMAEVHPRLVALRAEATEELSAVLTPEQMARLNEAHRAQDEAIQAARQDKPQ